MSDAARAHEERIEELKRDIHDLKIEVTRMEGLRAQMQKEADVAFAALDKIERYAKTVQAVRHLLRHDKGVLSGHAEPAIDGALASVISEIAQAWTKSDRLPF